MSSLDSGRTSRDKAALKGTEPIIAAPSDDAVAIYVRERQSKRLRGLDVPQHCPFDGRAGRYVYAGVRVVVGRTLILLRRDDDVVVMDTTTPKRWGRLRVGETVTVNARGFLTGRHR